MCLVSVLPKGTVKYNKEVEDFIRSGMKCNTQGSGYMFKRDGESTITIDKGYFDVEALLTSIKERNLNEEDEVVIHHRISTSGKVSKENSHPFVVSDEHEEVSCTNIQIDKPCLAHNGMFSKLTTFMSLNPDFSDTYAFSRYIMANDNIFNLYLEDKDLFLKVLDGILSYSRVAFLFPDRDLDMIGTFQEVNGYFHSNHGYKTYVYDRGGSSTQHRVWEEDDEYYERVYGYGVASQQTSRNPNVPLPASRQLAAPSCGRGSEWREVDTYSEHGEESCSIQDDKEDDSEVFNRATDDVDARVAAAHDMASQEEDESEKAEIIAARMYTDPDGVKVKLFPLEASTVISIGPNNFDHFYYVEKTDYYRQIYERAGLQLMTIDVFNVRGNTQSLVKKEKIMNSVINSFSPTSYIALTTKFFYIPKRLYLDAYEDLYFLVRAIKSIGKSTYKKIYDICERYKLKSDTHIVKYDRPECEHKQFSLLGLRLYRDYIKEQLELIEEKKKYAVMG